MKSKGKSFEYILLEEQNNEIQNNGDYTLINKVSTCLEQACLLRM